jgi:hypothetical protein
LRQDVSRLENEKKKMKEEHDVLVTLLGKKMEVLDKMVIELNKEMDKYKPKSRGCLVERCHCAESINASVAGNCQCRESSPWGRRMKTFLRYLFRVIIVPQLNHPVPRVACVFADMHHDA